MGSQGRRQCAAIKFENMKANLSQEVLKVIIAKKTSYDNDTVNYSWRVYCDPQALSFMHRGVIGDWKTQFSTEDSQRLEKNLS